MTFWSCRKNGLIRKIKFILIFMTSQPRHKQLQYTNCSISPESNQTTKINQLIEYNKKNILLKKSCRKLVTETSPRPLFVFFLNSVTWDKSKRSAAWFHYVLIALKFAYSKNKFLVEIKSIFNFAKNCLRS